MDQSYTQPGPIGTCLTCNESDLSHHLQTCASASAGIHQGCTEIVSMNINTGTYCMVCVVHLPPPHSTPAPNPPFQFQDVGPWNTLYHGSQEPCYDYATTTYETYESNTSPQNYPAHAPAMGTYPSSSSDTSSTGFYQHQPQQPQFHLTNIPIARATHNAKAAQDALWPKAELDLQPLLDGSLEGVATPPPVGSRCGGCGGEVEVRGCGEGECVGWRTECKGCGARGGCGHF